MIWTDKKTSLLVGKKVFRAGDKIPAGVLSDSRIAALKASGKISGSLATSPAAKEAEIYGMKVMAAVSAPVVEPVSAPVAEPVTDDESITVGNDPDTETVIEEKQRRGRPKKEAAEELGFDD